MDLIQEKIEIFADHIKGRQKKAAKSLVAEEQKKQQFKAAEAESALQKEKCALEERSYQVIYRDTNRLIAQGTKKAKEDRLGLNAVLRDDFSRTLLKTAADIRDTEVYRAYLKAAVQMIPHYFGDRRDLILICPESEAAFLTGLTTEYLDQYRIDLKKDESKDAFYGGFRVCDADRHFLCDFTLAHLIGREQKYIGRRLTELMAPYMEGAVQDEA